MKIRLLLIACLVLLVVTVCLGAQLGNGQFGGGQTDPPQRKPVQGLELINDLQLRRSPADDNGRFSIVQLANLNQVFLLDSRTGDTWLLTRDLKGHQSWLEVPRVRPEPKAEPEKKAERDPFE